MWLDRKLFRVCCGLFKFSLGMFIDCLSFGEPIFVEFIVSYGYAQGLFRV